MKWVKDTASSRWTNAEKTLWLQDWRALEDTCARAENSLMKYYLRTGRPRKQFIPEIMAA